MTTKALERTIRNIALQQQQEINVKTFEGKEHQLLNKAARENFSSEKVLIKSF